MMAPMSGGGLPPEMLEKLKRGFAASQTGAPEGEEPPQYRPAESPEQSCGNCNDFRPSGQPGAGACARFMGYPCEAQGVCDAWTAQGGGEAMAAPMPTGGGPMG